MIEIERIEWPDGNWWEFKKKLLYGVQRAITEAQRGVLTIKGTEAEIDWTKVNLAEISALLVLKSTTAWSFGEVTEKILREEVPDDYFKEVLARISELYNLLPLVEIGAKP